ncbi:hypothetical protein [uncultured Pseudoteredinibacter sp.]|uniref:hypothetical protein n=1 Tax=uncultured Pseudoteredinibacter sp. TaxID=1641701 RepID=UPI002602800B|nr:hypothetical protein [uncultured Pseudoteredinibacter sp.]
MDLLLQELVSLLNGNDPSKFIVVALFWLIAVTPILFSFWKNFRFSKQQAMIDALALPQLCGISRECLEESLAQESYRLCTGLDADKKLREAILLAFKSCPKKLPIRDYHRAGNFVKLSAGKLQVNIAWGDYFLAVYLFGSALFLYLCSMGLVAVVVLKQSATVSDMLYSLALTVVFLLGTYLSVLMAAPTVSAHRVKKSLALH